MGLRETTHYKSIGGQIAGSSNLSDLMLNYYRGMLYGLWIKQFTNAEKRTIIKHYTILRLER